MLVLTIQQLYQTCSFNYILSSYCLFILSLSSIQMNYHLKQIAQTPYNSTKDILFIWPVKRHVQGNNSSRKY